MEDVVARIVVEVLVLGAQLFLAWFVERLKRPAAVTGRGLAAV